LTKGKKRDNIFKLKTVKKRSKFKTAFKREKKPLAESFLKKDKLKVALELII